ncbi:protein FAM149A-like isoform X2 [Tubulanus polymorphus]|uniref:protein FAM149A-like isoform X2 n=1 Tax=Tubulanus polymorphus TaxID=672921 RepID=UPI003DA52EEE
MTGMYTRRTIPLEVRGISRTGQVDALSHPLPERADEDVIPDYLASIEEALAASVSHDTTPTVSGRSSPTAETHSFRSAVQINNGGWATGNTTERSSIDSSCSWDDEFDRQATVNVRHVFNEIDSMLFESNKEPEHLSNLAKECKEWSSQFVHLRILGKQVVPPQDDGFQLIPMDDSTGNMLVEIFDNDLVSHEPQILCINGQHVDAKLPPPGANVSYLEEEIFAQDGLYEDVIAVDYIDEGGGGRGRRGGRYLRKGYPPLTPNACLRDSVSNTTFDFAWSEIVSWMRVMIRMVTSDVIKKSAKGSGDLPEIPDLPIAISPSSRLPIDLPQRELTYPRFQEKSRWSTAQSNMDGSLASVLTISTKMLLRRENSNIPDVSEKDIIPRPGSSLKFIGRPPGARSSDTLHTHLTSARIKGAPRGRLAPLDRAKTPSVEEDRREMRGEVVIRGHRLQTVNDRSSSQADHLSSSPYTMFRNGALPPIGLESPEHPPPSQRGIRRNQFNRASSAIADKLENRVPVRDRERYAMPAENLNRPSTTHTFRSDTPFTNPARRSSTPLGITTLRAGLNVTGNSIPNPADYQLDEEDDEDFQDAHSHWVPSHPHPANNPYRRSKVISSLVR